MADDHEATMFVLLVAAGSGYIETVQALITHNPRLMNTTHCGFTPLTMASQLGSAGVVQFLLNCGVDVGVYGADGDTALHCAARRGRVEILGMLLLAGADVGSVNGRGEDCLVAAAAAGQAEVVEMLLTDNGWGGGGGGGDVNGAAVAAALADHVRVLCLLLDAGADPCSGSHGGRSDAAIVRVNGGDDEDSNGGSSRDTGINRVGIASPGRLMGGGGGDDSDGDELGAAAQVITLAEAQGAHKCARVLRVWGRVYELCKARRIRDAVLQLRAHPHTTNLCSLVNSPHHTCTSMGARQNGGSVEGWKRWVLKGSVRVPVYLENRLNHGGGGGADAAAADDEEDGGGGRHRDAGCGAAAAAAIDEYVRAGLPDVQVPRHTQKVLSVHATHVPNTHTPHVHSDDNTRATCKRKREGHEVFDGSAHVLVTRLRCAVVAHVLGKIGEELFVELMTDVGAHNVDR